MPGPNRLRQGGGPPKPSAKVEGPGLHLTRFASGLRGHHFLALELLLVNRAPVLVLGERHAALNADPDSDFRWLALTHQTLQQ